MTCPKTERWETLHNLAEGVYVFQNVDPDPQDLSTISVMLREVIHTCDSFIVLVILSLYTAPASPLVEVLY